MSDRDSRVPKRCPLCDQPYMATRELFTSSYEHGACESCRAKALRNSAKGRKELDQAIKEQP